MLDHYKAYKLESDMFGYQPNNFIHFLYCFFILKYRWIVDEE